MNGFKQLVTLVSLLILLMALSAGSAQDHPFSEIFPDGPLEFEGEDIEDVGVIQVDGGLIIEENIIEDTSGVYRINLDSDEEVLRLEADDDISLDLDMEGDSIQNIDELEDFFDSACDGEVLADVQNDGSFICVDPTEEVSEDFVDREGDTMTGTLDMRGNNIIDIGDLTGTGIVNSDQISSSAVGSSEIEVDSVTLDELDESDVDGRYVTVDGDAMEGTLDMRSNSIIDIGNLEGSNIVNTAQIAAEAVGLNELEEDTITINTGNHLVDGGSVTLGDSITLNVDPSGIDWTDTSMDETDVDLSDVGAADTDLNMNNYDIENINELAEFFDSACPAGEAVVDIDDDGSILCTDVSDDVSDDYVSRDGDSMTGTLDMTGNDIIDIGNLEGSSIVNAAQIASSAVGSSEISSSAVTSTELDESDSYDISWTNLAITQSDVDLSDVGVADTDLDMNNQDIQNINELAEFFDSACPTGEAVVDVNDDGNLVCMDVSDEVSGDYVNRDGDSMTGDLDMRDNEIELDNNQLSGETISFDGSSSTGLRAENENGYISLTPLNSGWAHIYTDRSDFIFNEPVSTTANEFFSYNDDLVLRDRDTDNTISIGSDIDMSTDLDISGDIGISGTMTSGTVPWARLNNHPSIDSGTGLTGGGSLDSSQTLELESSYETGSEYDGRFVNRDGDTMNGDFDIDGEVYIEASGPQGFQQWHRDHSDHEATYELDMGWAGFGVQDADTEETLFHFDDSQRMAIGERDSSHSATLDVYGDARFRDDVNLDGNSINNFFDSECPSGEALFDVNNDGSFDCMDVSDDVADDYVNRDGDTMTGTLVINEDMGSTNSGLVLENDEYAALQQGEFEDDLGRVVDEDDVAMRTRYRSSSGSRHVNQIWHDAGGVSFWSNDDVDDEKILDVGSDGTGDIEIPAGDLHVSGDITGSDWGDLDIDQSDVQVSDLGASDDDLDMDGNDITRAGLTHTDELLVSDSPDDGPLPATDNSAYIEGDLSIDGDFIGAGADLAEIMEVSDNQEDELEPGEVVVLDENLTVKRSEEAKDTGAAGVVSTDPAMVMAKDRDGVELALSGTAPVKVTVENGEIQPGDLLTTSDEPGKAMKCEKPVECHGSIIGKAGESISSDGEIEMVITLS